VGDFWQYLYIGEMKTVNKVAIVAVRFVPTTAPAAVATFVTDLPSARLHVNKM
jgi:hypothetical protein